MKKISISIIILIIIIISLLTMRYVSTGTSNTDTIVKATDERGLVGSYVRANIKELAPESPVLGGQWYAVEVAVDESLDSGLVIYEDGHIQGSAYFRYAINNGKVQISEITKTP